VPKLLASIKIPGIEIKKLFVIFSLVNLLLVNLRGFQNLVGLMLAF